MKFPSEAKRMKIAVDLAILGSILAIAGLLKSHPATMMAWMMVGMPCLLLAVALYLSVVFKDLKEHQVLGKGRDRK